MEHTENREKVSLGREKGGKKNVLKDFPGWSRRGREVTEQWGRRHFPLPEFDT